MSNAEIEGQNQKASETRAKEIVAEIVMFVDRFGGEAPPSLNELTQMGDVAVQPILRAVTEVRPGEDTSTTFENRGRLCRVLGEIGTVSALKALRQIVTLPPNLWEYTRYVRPAANRPARDEPPKRRRARSDTDEQADEHAPAGATSWKKRKPARRQRT